MTQESKVILYCLEIGQERLEVDVVDALGKTYRKILSDMYPGCSVIRKQSHGNWIVKLKGIDRTEVSSPCWQRDLCGCGKSYWIKLSDDGTPVCSVCGTARDVFQQELKKKPIIYSGIAEKNIDYYYGNK